MYNAIFLVSGLLCMFGILQLIPKRIANMPLAYNIREEEEIIASIKKNTLNLPGLQLIESASFAYPTHSAIWECKDRAINRVQQGLIPEKSVRWVEENYSTGESFETLLKRAEKESWVVIDKNEISIQVENYILSIIRLSKDRVGFSYDGWEDKIDAFEIEFNAELVRQDLQNVYQNIINSSEEDVTNLEAYQEKINDFAANLISCHEDRTSYNGINKIIVTGERETPLVREATKPSSAMQAISLIITLLGSVAILNFENNWYGRVALLILLVASLEWAIVDLMTMYLDDKAFYLGVSLGWGLTILSLWNQGELTQLIPGLVFTLTMVIIFEGINKYFRYRRGMDGLGFGDTLIVVGTVGIPTALAGAWVLGYRIVMLSFILGIIGFFYMKVTRKHKKTQPFAFGPYLAIGWVFGIVSWILTNGISGLAF